MREWFARREARKHERPWYDTMQVCEKGHIITRTALSHPEEQKKRCLECGGATFTACPSCNTRIPGYHHLPYGVTVDTTPPPSCCENCGGPYPWVKPESPAKKNASAQPTGEAGCYERALRIIRDTGVEMERHPAVYHGKDEESLRDHFLTVLTTHFGGSTGETFNKSGKTDILIRHEGQNVFIAECKFWGGIKGFHETIDQLLGYLTWRDSKAAVINFERNKELNPVLETIGRETPNHPCFVKDHGRKEEGWFRFEFHLAADATRAVRVAVLVFHMP